MLPELVSAGEGAGAKTVTGLKDSAGGAQSTAKVSQCGGSFEGGGRLRYVSMLRTFCHPLLLAAGLVLVGTAIPAGAEDIAVLQDSDVYQFMNMPTSSVDDLDVTFNDAGHMMHTFIEFDLTSSVFTSSTVETATLWLFTEAVGTAGQLSVRDVTSAWNVATLTWAGQPGTGSFVVTENITTLGTWYGIDITELAKDWLDNPADNHGVRLSFETAGNAKFESNDDTEPATRPFLQLVPEPSSALLFAAGIVPFFFRRRQSREIAQ
jgi:hypothetical protein